MNDVELRQFAMLQLENILDYEVGSSADRLWAALYCVQAMHGGPVPKDFGKVIQEAADLDGVEV